MPLHRFRERRRRKRAGCALYEFIVAQARQPQFYLEYGVPDTLEGRFDMIVLHMWLLFRRIGATSFPQAEVLSQEVFDLMFVDMDRNLREMGVSDLRVGKRVEAMSQDFYGRIGAYDRALVEGEDALGEALKRNLYQTGAPTVEHLGRMSRYVLHQVRLLDDQGPEQFLAGKVTFAAPQGQEGGGA